MTDLYVIHSHPQIKFEEIRNCPFTKWTRTSRFLDYKQSKYKLFNYRRNEAIW